MEKVIAIITDKTHSNEFLTLVKEAGFDVKGIFYVKNITTNVLSEYKLKQLRGMVENIGDVDKLVFDLELRPRQAYKIAKETQLETIDRIQVILKIFLAHAPSQEAKLQIKLASLKYELARVKEKVRLAKMGEQPGFSGLGAYEVDIYYNEIKKRIEKILEKIEEIRKRRKVHRIMRLRKNFRTISITGYTCSGKTTLFNILTNSLEKVGNEPFTTLSTKFKLIKIGPWKVYLSDTIGFINNLPPFMIHAFRSTLEEVSFSEIVILLIDGSEEKEVVKEKFKVSFNLLIDLGVVNKPILAVINKIDLVKEKSRLEEIKKYILNFTPYVVEISAKKGEKIDELTKKLEQLLGVSREVEIILPLRQEIYKTIGFIKERGKLIKLRGDRGKVLISAIIPEDFREFLKKEVSKIRGAMKIKR